MSTWLALTSALWLGLLTAISPCPLATNIAAMSYLGRRVGRMREVIGVGTLYAAGRMLTYVLLAMLLLAGVMASDFMARFLQKYLNLLLGPLLIIIGAILLELVGEGISVNAASQRLWQRLASGGPWGALALGVLFALSFCPASAALYFGALLPLAASAGSRVLVPALYGLGTALPVVAFAVLVAVGGQAVARAFNELTRVERWLRLGTGGIFLLVGLYLSLVYAYGVRF